MAEQRFPSIFVRVYPLDAVGVFEVDFPVSSYAVMYFDGAADSVKIRSTQRAEDPNAITLLSGAADSWPEAGKKYIANSTAQAGKIIRIKWGGLGTNVTVPSSLISGDANAANQVAIKASVDAVAVAVAAVESDVETVAGRLANQASVAFREVTVGTSQTQLSTLTVPHGHAAHIYADEDNDTNPIYLHLVDDGGASNVFKMKPGRSVSLAVTNVNVIYATCAVGTNKLYIAVEQAS